MPSVDAPISDEQLKELAGAANDAARREASQWIAFVSLMVFLAISIGTTTHRALLDQRPMRLPLLNIDVPLVTFFCIAPLIVVIIHFYIQAQLTTVSTKVARFLAAARERARTETAEAAAAADDRSVEFGIRLEAQLEPLDGFAAAQLKEAAQASRRLAAARMMTTVTLSIAPTALLVFFLLKFLPYQLEPVTWFHRFLIVFCILSSLYFRALQRDRALDPLRFVAQLARDTLLFAPNVRRRAGVIVGAIIFLSVATVRGESIDWLDHPLRPSWLVYDGQIDPRTSRPPPWLFSRVLVLPDERLITQSESEVRAELLARTSVLRARSLRGAVLSATDLRKADLTGADLRAARLDGAWLENSYLGDARMQGAQLDGANLRGAWLGNARLQAASLDGAALQGARLDGAQLQGASLEHANFQGASLENASLQGASLRAAQMQGAFLLRAQLQGASFISADLRAADLRRVRAWRTEFDAANLDLAALPDGGILGDADIFSETPPPIDAERVENWAAWVGLALAETPYDDARAAARERLEILVHTGSRVTLHRPLSRMMPEGRVWQAAPSATGGVAAYLATLVCARDNFPFVLHGILHQIWTDEMDHRRALGSPARETLAAHLLDGEACAVADDLPRESRARLEFIATLPDPAPWIPAAAE